MKKIAAAFFLTLCAMTTQAQPSAIRIMVGFPPGGGTDVIARLLGEHLGQSLGSNVVVENKAGAGGQIAAQALKAAAPDGSVLFLSHDHTISILPLVIKNPGFHPAQDFVPVVGFATFANGLALSGGTPGKTYAQYVEWLRTQDKTKLSIGIPAPASVPEFLVKVLASQTKLDLQPVPYRGSAPMLADMLGNQIAAGVGSVPDFIEYVKAGKVRVVAVIGQNRQTLLPEVPTFAELGLPGFEDLPYYGLFAPKGIAQALIDRYSSAISTIIALPSVRERLESLGLTVEFMTAEALGRRERAYSQSWANMIRESGFVPQ